jgi:hypothetical protein
MERELGFSPWAFLCRVSAAVNPSRLIGPISPDETDLFRAVAQAVTDGLPVILTQLHETIFANLLQALLRSSNQGQSTLLQLCY